MRRVYLDTEFVPEWSGVRGLISIGLVTDDGREYYAVNAEMDTQIVQARTWLRKHVWPQLPLTVDEELDNLHPDVKTVGQIRKELTSFFSEKQSETYAWYGCQDLGRLHSLWGNDWTRMPEDIPRWHHELESMIKLVGNPPMPVQRGGEHNALEDAKFNKLMHDSLIERGYW